jgi:hypothetical protein
MNKQNINDAYDLLYVVISKLCFMRDFMQALDDNVCISKLTPNGLSCILSENIEALKKIGGFND